MVDVERSEVSSAIGVSDSNILTTIAGNDFRLNDDVLVYQNVSFCIGFNERRVNSLLMRSCQFLSISSLGNPENGPCEKLFSTNVVSAHSRASDAGAIQILVFLCFFVSFIFEGQFSGQTYNQPTEDRVS